MSEVEKCLAHLRDESEELDGLNDDACAAFSSAAGSLANAIAADKAKHSRLEPPAGWGYQDVETMCLHVKLLPGERSSSDFVEVFQTAGDYLRVEARAPASVVLDVLLALRSEGRLDDA